jgi:alkyl sulfatase BDS1-like metallo-beta-lactamase superfamily hydrolase
MATNKILSFCVYSLALLSSSTLQTSPANSGEASSNVPPSESTKAYFSSSTSNLDWGDQRDFKNAERGLIATPENKTIVAENGQLVWVFKDYQSLKKQPAPDTVHPILWRQTQLNASTGLFRVTDRIYQVRGFDLANMTIIESNTGIIIIDPLTAIESARAALAFYSESRGEKPVRAVIYSHNHMDHFGGVAGVVSKEQVSSGQVKIFAPLNFEKEAITESLLAGNAMLRRTIWYSGIPLPRSPYGTVDAGLGPGVANGMRSYIAPTNIIESQMETHVIDGFPIEFYLASNTEAPSEMVMFYPDEKVLNVSEVAVHTVHNLLTPRGTKVRDTLEWVKILNVLLHEYAPRSEIMIAQHHWPTWGRENIAKHLQNQRDFYKFAHDRSMYLANQGYNKEEISEMLSLPSSLAKEWTLQDYYGTLGSAGKAVFQFYLGWYDGNPAKLQQLSESKSAGRYVDYMGGSDAILKKAKADLDAGNYQWVVQVLQHVIFAEPDNQRARDLAADAFIQLGYQQTSATWRNLYLSAAHELRNGIMEIPVSASGNVFIEELTPENILDYAGISLDSRSAELLNFTANVFFTDLEQTYSFSIENRVLSYIDEAVENADLTLSTDKNTFAQLFRHQLSLMDGVERGLIRVEGDAAGFKHLLESITVFSPNFSLVSP